MEVTLGNISAIILAIGALGAAAYGVVESFGKAMASSEWEFVDEATGTIGPKRRVASLWTRFRGLPYVGFTAVQDFMAPLAPALMIAYGVDYQKIVLGHYRNGRAAGEAPGAIRRGVRMGIALLSGEQLRYVLSGNWGLDIKSAETLAAALEKRNLQVQDGDAPSSDALSEGLLATFVTVLDARLDAAFSVAEERYQAAARSWAAVASIVMVAGLNWIAINTDDNDVSLPWEVALFIGAVAVPLAPVTKDLARALSEAVGAFRALRLSR